MPTRTSSDRTPVTYACVNSGRLRSRLAIFKIRRFPCPRSPLRTHPKTEDESPRRWRRWKWLLLLLIPLIVWQVWRVVSSGRQLAKARELQAQMADPNLPPEKRQQLFQDMRSSMANLTSEQRGILFADQQKRQEQELDRYFAMSKAFITEQRDILT